MSKPHDNACGYICALWRPCYYNTLYSGVDCNITVFTNSNKSLHSLHKFKHSHEFWRFYLVMLNAVGFCKARWRDQSIGAQFHINISLNIQNLTICLCIYPMLTALFFMWDCFTIHNPFLKKVRNLESLNDSYFCGQTSCSSQLMKQCHIYTT